MCVQAGLFILQLLFPNTKQGKAKRQESIKLGVIEVCVHSNFSCTLMYWHLCVCVCVCLCVCVSVCMRACELFLQVKWV